MEAPVGVDSRWPASQRRWQVGPTPPKAGAEDYYILLYIIKLMEPMAMKLKKYMCVVPPTTGSKFLLECFVVSFSLGLLPFPSYSIFIPSAILHSLHLSSRPSFHSPTTT